jgi:hypothetical protein
MNQDSSPVAIPSKSFDSVSYRTRNIVFDASTRAEFCAELRKWGTQRRENFLIPNSLWRISLIVETVVRKCWAITLAQTNRCFRINASSCGPKLREVRRSAESLCRINHRSWTSEARFWCERPGMNRRRVCSSVLHVFVWRPNLSAREISSRIFAPPSPSIVDDVFHKPQGLRTIYFILWLSLREFFMIVCLVWFFLMTREGEIGMKSSAPGDSRGAGDFFYPLHNTLKTWQWRPLIK